MATYYRKKVGDLRSALTGDHFHETAEIIRSLIEEILLTPVEKEGRKSLSINLNGDIASILALAAKAKAPLDESDASLRVTKKLVAGARYQRYLPGLSCRIPLVR